MPAQAALTTFCDGTAGAVTVPGDLVVGQGDSCDLTGTTIAGSVTVRASGNLLLSGTTVQGDLTVRQDGFVTAEAASTFDGRVVLRGAYGAHLDDSSVGGQVNVRQSGFYFGLGTQHDGGLRTEGGGEIFLERATVAGDVRTAGSELTDIYNSTITGSAIIDAPDRGSVVCTSEVDGHLAVSDSGGLVQIGSDGPNEPCWSTYVGGDLRVNGTTGDSFVSANIIRGNLECDGNDPGPVGQNNRVRGERIGQCANLPRPPVALSPESKGMKMLGTEAEAEVEVEVRSEAESLATSRAEAAKAAAAKAGPAELVG